MGALSVRAHGAGMLVFGAVLLLQTACSPEARRLRDGGPGGDPGNKRLVAHESPDPQAADTTLWPGRATAPVDLLARGVIATPSYPPAGQAAPASPSQQRTFDRGGGGDSRSPESGSPTPPAPAGRP